MNRTTPDDGDGPDARLRERELALERERALFAEGPVILFQWRAAEGWPVDYVSDNVRQLGYTPAQLTSGEVPFASLVHPQDLARVAEEVQRHTSAGRSYFDQEYRLIRADGEERWYYDVTHVLRDEEGRAIRYHGYILDITGRHLVEEALEDNMQELARSNAELEQFAYVASHDLQEPLRMVTSYLNLLQKRYGSSLDADAHEFIGFAVDGAVRMQKLIDDLLAYSRIGRKGMAWECVSLDEVFDAALADMQLQIADCGAEVTRDPLPVVDGDPHELRQLLENLIGNALKYRREGVVPCVHVSAEREARHWICSVSDNGIGIEARHQERVFEIFQRLHGRDRYPGTGIGLAICKKIVQHHGGRIWLESTPGEGSRFLFTLPVRNG
ncbi:MAG: ATP-binding protein [Chromatiales bacterium]|nr:ATP-binding protein [Chromatiales bacterium]MDX9766094.1 ATP-binding protein [Ectothiorhodospiraceae bacterium]